MAAGINPKGETIGNLRTGNVRKQSLIAFWKMCKKTEKDISLTAIVNKAIDEYLANRGWRVSK